MESGQRAGPRRDGPRSWGADRKGRRLSDPERRPKHDKDGGALKVETQTPAPHRVRAARPPEVSQRDPSSRTPPNFLGKQQAWGCSPTQTFRRDQQ